MDRISKIGLLSLERQWSLVALNVPTFFKNKCHEENKNTLNKKHLNDCHCSQPKQHIHSCYGSKKIVKQILNLDDRLYTLQKYVVCKSRVEIGHTFMEISLNLSDITDFL